MVKKSSWEIRQVDIVSTDGKRYDKKTVADIFAEALLRKAKYGKVRMLCSSEYDRAGQSERGINQFSGTEIIRVP